MSKEFYYATIEFKKNFTHCTPWQLPYDFKVGNTCEGIAFDNESNTPLDAEYADALKRGIIIVIESGA